MKTIKFILLLTLSCGMYILARSQSSDNPNNFYTIKAKRMAEFEEQARLYGMESLKDEGSEYQEFMKWVNYWEPRLAPHGEFEKYFELERNYEKYLKKESTVLEKANTDPWYEVGPTQIPTGTLTSIGGGKLGIGPIRFIHILKSNANFMLAGTGGGLFKSSDGGLTWANANSDDWTRSGCAYAEFDPANSNNIFAASNGWLGYVKGIWRTTNNGTTWDRIGDNGDLGGDYSEIKKVVVDPNNSGYVYVATTRGLFRSTNAYALPASAVSWTKVYPTSGDEPIYDLEIKHGSPDVLFATVGMGEIEPGYTSLVPGNMVVSTNNGGNWSQVPNFPVIADVVRITIEVSEAAPNMVWVLFIKSTNSADLYTYNSAGNIWIYKSTRTDAVTFGGGHSFGVSNFDVNYVLLAGGIHLARSSDGGVTWTSVNGSSAGFHVDLEDIVSAPASCTVCSNHFWMGNHGGAFKSTDNGASWAGWSNGLGVAEVFGMSTSYTNPERMGIGLFHDGTMLSNGTFANGWTPTWNTVNGGDGLQPLLDRNNPDLVFASSQNSGYSKSLDYGNSFSGTALSAGGWFTYITQSEALPNAIFGRGFVGANADVYRSTDLGTTKQFISNFAGAPYNLTSYAQWKMYTSPSDPNRVYTHTLYNNEHRIYTVDNALDPNPALVVSNWVECSVPLLTKWINSVAVDRQNPRIIYITYNSSDVGINGLANGLIYKVDYTSSFTAPVITDLTFNVPPAGGTDIVLENGSNGGIYVSSDFGVWFTNNDRLANQPANSKWIQLGSNLPNLGGSLRNLEINYTANKIRFGSMGRGVWEHDLYCSPTTDIVYGNINQNGVLFAEAYNNVTSAAIIGNTANVNYRGGNTVRLTNGFRAIPGSYFRAFIHGCDQPGNSFKSLDSEWQIDEEATSGLTVGENEVLLFPNPANQVLNISVASSGETIRTVNVYDMNGRICLTVPVDNNDSAIQPIDISQLPNGFYIAEIVSNDKKWMSKFSKHSE